MKNLIAHDVSGPTEQNVLQDGTCNNTAAIVTVKGTISFEETKCNILNYGDGQIKPGNIVRVFTGEGAYLNYTILTRLYVDIYGNGVYRYRITSTPTIPTEYNTYDCEVIGVSAREAIAFGAVSKINSTTVSIPDEGTSTTVLPGDYILIYDDDTSDITEALISTVGANIVFSPSMSYTNIASATVYRLREGNLCLYNQDVLWHARRRVR